MAQRPTPYSALRWVFLGVCALVVAKRTYAVSLRKAFTLDEFQWAHAAWELARGSVPYRDFFEVHFPLNYQYMSLVYRFGDLTDPTAIVDMRLMMLPLLALMAWAMWRVNHREGQADLALLAPILAFSLPSWVTRATEIRHDPMAFALFLAALACLYVRRGPVKVRAAASGLCLALACWATQKALVYGVIFGGALLADLAVNRRRDRPCLLGDPLAFLAGAGLVVFAVALWIQHHGLWTEVYTWCFEWANDYQKKQPGFSWWKKLTPMLRYSWWYFGLAGIGLARTLSELRSREEPAHPDQLLVLAWLSTWASWALQQAPWSYSGIPFLGMTCVFAGRGAAAVLDYAHALHRDDAVSPFVLTLPLLALFALALVRAGSNLDDEVNPPDRHDLSALAERYFDDEEQNLLGPPNSAEGIEVEEPDDDEDEDDAKDDDRPKWERFLLRPEWARFDEPQNEYQLRVLAKVAELTDPDDAVYDNTGTFVARPHAYWFYYTFRSIWSFHADMLDDEVPEAIESSRAVMVLMDSRYPALPKKLRGYLEKHYQPYNGDIWLAGQRYRPKGEPGERQKAKFFAVIEGEYFVYPGEDLERLALTVDGRPVKTPKLKLKAGKHRIEYDAGADDFAILWLPRNGETWHPNRESKAHFCCRTTTG